MQDRNLWHRTSVPGSGRTSQRRQSACGWWCQQGALWTMRWAGRSGCCAAPCASDCLRPETQPIAVMRMCAVNNVHCFSGDARPRTAALPTQRHCPHSPCAHAAAVPTQPRCPHSRGTHPHQEALLHR
jgi:hypothetical protein